MVFAALAVIVQTAFAGVKLVWAAVLYLDCYALVLQTALASVEDLPVLPPMAAPSAGYRQYYSSFGEACCAFLPICPVCRTAGVSTCGIIADDVGPIA